MQDLTWIKTLFDNYKKGLETGFDEGWVTVHDYKYKRQAADELLDQIKRFIKDANEVVNQQNSKE